MRLFGNAPTGQLLPRGERLSFTDKLGRLADRMKQPEWRRYAKLLVAGKLLGIAAVFAIMFAVEVAPNIMGGSSAVAQAPAAAPAAAPATPPDPYAAVKGGDVVNPLNTLWVLLAAFLVFGMQVGFTM